MDQFTFTTPSNVIALDVGEARIGMAVGRVGSTLAFGRGVIYRKQRNAKGKLRQRPLDDVLTEVVTHAQAENTELVVVGLPRRQDGGDSAQTQRVRVFADALCARGLQVVLEDERYTSAIAGRQLVTSGLPKHKRQDKGRIDEGAAVLILESYLTRQLNEEHLSQQKRFGQDPLETDASLKSEEDSL
ncbi:MAG: Holliday junction resolvase RuvX [Deinococcota bacterium]